MKIYCKCGKSAEALEILEIMKEEKIRPNEITYHILLAIYLNTSV